MQVMNSRIERESPEGKLFSRAYDLGLPVARHTFYDGPDRYERIVIKTEGIVLDPLGNPRWQWSDVADLNALLAQVQQLDPNFADPWK